MERPYAPQVGFGATEKPKIAGPVHGFRLKAVGNFTTLLALSLFEC
jgi:hypothetical protein